jgi:hypothetical protein
MTYTFKPYKVTEVYTEGDGYSFDDDEENLYHNGTLVLTIDDLPEDRRFFKIDDCCVVAQGIDLGPFSNWDHSASNWERVLGPHGLTHLTWNAGRIFTSRECLAINKDLVAMFGSGYGDKPTGLGAMRSAFGATASLPYYPLLGSGFVYYF